MEQRHCNLVMSLNSLRMIAKPCLLELLFASMLIILSAATDCNTADKYKITMDKILGNEGLCQNYKSDRGNTYQGRVGYTCLGLTPGTAYNNRKEFLGCSGFTGHPADFSKFCYDKSPANFKNGAIAIYRKTYFKPCEHLLMPAFYVCSDISVNSGSGTAQRFLTELGSPNGQTSKDYARKLNEKHRQLYKKLGGSNLRGWLNRAASRDRYIDSC